jgi:uncharacterized repeat protein (TIGR03847 family)
MRMNLGPVDLLGADAVGQPGQRRFRLFARSRRAAMLIWIEKEQLNNLSLELDRLLAQLTEGRVLRTIAEADESAMGAINRPLPGMPTNFPKTPDYELQASGPGGQAVQMILSYDEGRDLFELLAMPVDVILQADQEPQAVIREDEAVSLLFTQEQAHKLSSTITTLVSSGRPVCPLCHTPLEEGPHACVRQNGHREIVIASYDDGEAEEDEEE